MRSTTKRSDIQLSNNEQLFPTVVREGLPTTQIDSGGVGQKLRPSVSSRLAPHSFFRVELRDAFDQSHRDRLGEWKTDCAFADLVRCELVLERRDHGFARGVQRVVLLPASKVQYHPTMQSVSRDLVGDHFFGSWQGFAERAS